jgi:2-C-methyl-D-erythritol 4-phosphate cytidylyltransferase
MPLWHPFLRLPGLSPNGGKRMDTFGVVVVAAGKGTRMGTAESKQYLQLCGKPILVHTLETFERMDEAGEVVLVAGASEVERCRKYAAQYGLRKVRVVPGGAERQHSVYAGLKALGPDVQWVLVHDGVRPFAAPEHILSCWREAVAHGAAVLAVPVKDTIKVVDADGIIRATPERRTLWAIQTPQAFRRSLLEEAHAAAERDNVLGTDDAMLVERLGQPVRVVEADYTNIKITTPDDLAWAEWYAERNGGRT